MKTDTRAAGRSFLRNLNILLKYARLYEFGHARTAAQFETTWRELHTALKQSGNNGILLGASGNQILLDGEPFPGAAAERGFAQLLSSSGIASIHFGPNATQSQFARFVRAFPTGPAKPQVVAEQIKAALAGETNIKINEIRYVAEDSSIADVKVAAQLTAKVFGAHGDKFKELLEDPQKILQLILAAEGTRGSVPGPGGPGAGAGESGTTGSPAWAGGPGAGAPGSLWEAGRQGGGSGGGGVGGGAGTGSGGPGGGGAGIGLGGPGGGAGTAGAGPGMGTGAGTGAGTGTGTGTGTGQGPMAGFSAGGPGAGAGGAGVASPGGGWGTGTGAGTGTGSGAGSGARTGTGGGAGTGSGSGSEEGTSAGRWMAALALLRGGLGTAGGPGSSASAGVFLVAEDDIRSMLSLFAQLGRARNDPESKFDASTFQSRLSAMPLRAQYTLQQALAGLAAQAPNEKPDKPMLLRLAEHIAIRFALDSYERGELRVNAVKQLLDRMNQEIEGLRKILGQHEEVMAGAGLQVKSYTELLDQEFWEQVPEENKRQVLTSEEAWCVPPRNVRAFLEEMLRRGELKTVNEILLKYCACISLAAPEARRTTAIGLADLAELYGSGDGSALMDAIRRLGNQLGVEHEQELQMLISAAFVRLSQEAASKRFYPAVQQALASLDSVEAQRPGSTQNLRPRIGAEERLPEFIEEALRSGEIADGMVDILQLMPRASIRYITNRFGSCGFREDCALLAQIMGALGEECGQALGEMLENAAPAEAVETVGLLSLIAPESVEKMLPVRLGQWPRTIHDRAVRLLSAAPADRRARLLVASFRALDPLIQPLAVDEMGITGHADCIPLLLDLMVDERKSGYLRVKAIEALGRLRAQAASVPLQHILDARQVWRWVYPAELRIASAQALMRIDPVIAMERLAVSGLDRKDLTLEPVDPEQASTVIRYRRYARLKLSRPLTGVTANLRENFKLLAVELNLGGGLAATERHIAPGTLLSLKFSGPGVRAFKAQVIARGARPQAMAFEFVDMELEERLRLRRTLLEMGEPPQTSSVGNRSRRRGRVTLAR